MTAPNALVGTQTSTLNNLRSALKRKAYQTGLNVRSKTGEMAQRLADKCLAPPPQVEAGVPKMKPSNFADHHIHATIRKHMELPKLFGFSNPFYRSHGVRKGAETIIDGQSYVNFASYDYLGLNQHPAVLAAAS